jgi:hypothetical protein
MKTYKKGETVWLWCCTHDSRSSEKEKLVLTTDMTTKELEKIAEEFFWDRKEPEWGFFEEEPDDRY